MASLIQTVSSTAVGGQNLPNSVRTQYIENYIEAAEMARIYDQIAAPIGKDMSNLARGSSVQVDALSDMQPGTSAISEVSDIAMQALRDATLSITPTSRGEGIQCSELLLNQAYTDYGAARFGIVGKGLMESLEVLARDVACQGCLNDAGNPQVPRLQGHGRGPALGCHHAPGSLPRHPRGRERPERRHLPGQGHHPQLRVGEHRPVRSREFSLGEGLWWSRGRFDRSCFSGVLHADLLGQCSGQDARPVHGNAPGHTHQQVVHHRHARDRRYALPDE